MYRVTIRQKREDNTLRESQERGGTKELMRREFETFQRWVLKDLIVLQLDSAMINRLLTDVRQSLASRNDC